MTVSGEKPNKLLGIPQNIVFDPFELGFKNVDLFTRVFATFFPASQ